MLTTMTDADWVTVSNVFAASRSRRGDNPSRSSPYRKNALSDCAIVWSATFRLERQVTAFIGRREVITLLSGAAAWPLAAEAQQRSMPVVGFLNIRSPGDSPHLVSAFHQGLRETGYVEGQNLT